MVLLRQCTIAEKKVRLNDDLLEFDGQIVHRNAKCGFRLSPTESCIDIGSVWYMFKEISGDKPYTPEVTKKRGFRYIGVAHRGDLCDYLVGRVDTCKGLEIDVVEGRKRPKEDDDGALRGKRLRHPGQRLADLERVAAGRGASATQEAPGEVPALLGRHKVEGASQEAPAGEKPWRQAAPSRSEARPEVKTTDISQADVLARVRPVKDLDVLVRCPGRTVPNADLILKIAQDEVNNWHLRRRPERHPDMLPDGGKVPLIKELETLVSADKKSKPIILVPCNKNAPVNLLNAAKFLQDGFYDKTDAEHVRFFESTRPEFVEVVRNVAGRMWTFEVRDTAKNFTKAQWLRVVAVITDGSNWQFKGWPFETVVDLFTTVKGVFFREVNTLTPLHVTQWAVSILDMAPVQFQHRFSELRDAFWVEVERFLTAFRSKKYVNHTTLETVRLSTVKPKPVL